MFQRPIFTPIVICLWCVTVGWLATAKILPTLQQGSPPGQLAVVTTTSGFAPVAWTVSCNERPIGWALMQASAAAGGGAIVDSRLHFERLPWNVLLPDWVSTLVERPGVPDAPATFDAHGRLAIDPEGQVQAFVSIVQMPGAAHPMVFSGRAHDDRIDVTMAMGEARYETSRRLPAGVAIGDELSPQATLPGLFPGRRWTVPVFNPLRSGTAPIEILHASVGEEETLFWEDALVRVHVVEYREEVTGGGEPRCRLWVDRSGRVLRQESAILGVAFVFVRRTDSAAERLAAHAAEQPSAVATVPRQWAEVDSP